MLFVTSSVFILTHSSNEDSLKPKEKFGQLSSLQLSSKSDLEVIFTVYVAIFIDIEPLTIQIGFDLLL
mgnify:CR=1 FL=1